MSDLIKRFRDDLQLAGYAKRSTDSYVSSVLRLQRFHNKPLEDISEEELRQYWLCCQSEFGWGAATLRISYAGIQHFFTRTLVRSWGIFKDIKWKREQTLPTILSLQEVRKIIYALPTLQSHTFYLTLYSLGLRLREATTLQIGDILSDRGLVHVKKGKGALDRTVPLPKITLSALRKYYKTHRNPKWLFPALGHNGGKDAQFAKDHVSDSGVQGVLPRTLKRLESKKHIHPHVFRHAYVIFWGRATRSDYFYYIIIEIRPSRWPQTPHLGCKMAPLRAIVSKTLSLYIPAITVPTSLAR